MCESGVARAEIDGIETAGREVRDVRPRLLRGHGQVPGVAQRTDGRPVDDYPCRRGIAHHVEVRAVRSQLREVGLGLVGLPVWRIPEIEGCGRLTGDHVVRDAGLETCNRNDLAELEPSDDGRTRLELEKRREPANRPLDRVVGEPRTRGVAARPPESQTRDDVAEASGLELEVGWLQHDRERRLVNRLGARKEGGERVVVRGQLLAAEDEQREIAARSSQLDVSCDLERDGEASLHVARAEAVHVSVGDPSGEIPLRRNGVVVRGEDDQRAAGAPRRGEEVRLVARVLGDPARRDEGEHVLADSRLVTALRRNVHELERPRGEAVGERGHRRSVPRHNPAVTARQPDPAPGAEPERGLLLGVYPKRAAVSDDLAELAELARTAGVLPVGEVVQHRSHPDPRSFVGKGKLAELERTFADAAAEALLVDDELSPTQQRTLEDALKTRVVDRTQLILDIFAQHARSADGKLQVELAQLEYNLPRMRGMWQHLERLGGGVGTRGPGESQLETDRRLARTRVSLLKKRLRTLESQRSTRRKERTRTSAPTIALAGYTNVGKSTLLNALTGADASVDDRLFETLDPTTRGFEHDGKRYLVTDTVGFIKRLPTQLVEGFAATLEETLVADLVLHVADASLPEERLAETIAAVASVLAEIGADDIPVELVLNKADALDPLARRRIEHAYPRALMISARTGEGLDALKDRIAELFSDRFEDVRLLVPYADGRALAALYDLGAPIAERRDTPEGVRIRARLPRAEAARFARYLVADELDLEKASAR